MSDPSNYLLNIQLTALNRLTPKFSIKMRFLFLLLVFSTFDFSGAEPITQEALNKKLFEDMITFQKMRYMNRIHDDSIFDKDGYGDFGSLI
jgi:hypothetical protein